jgi:hypothetical protein
MSEYPKREQRIERSQVPRLSRLGTDPNPSLLVSAFPLPLSGSFANPAVWSMHQVLCKCGTIWQLIPVIHRKVVFAHDAQAGLMLLFTLNIGGADWQILKRITCWS